MALEPLSFVSNIAMSLVSSYHLLKNKLPGNPNSASIGLNLHWSKEKRRSTTRPVQLIKHEEGRKLEGWPGSYYSWPTTFFKLGPLNGSIHWKPWDRLSEEEYRDKYGTYDAVEETRWDRERREAKEKKANERR